MKVPDRTVHRFFATPTAPCPYLPGRTERKLFTPLVGGDPNRLHDLLSASGFRRSQSIVYKPACDGCRACVPVRIRAADFVASRTQRKIERRNAECRETHVEELAEQHAHGECAGCDRKSACDGLKSIFCRNLVHDE